MKKLLLGLFTLSMLTGCASSLMSPVQDADNTLPKDKAVITFYRPSTLGFAIQAPIAKDTPEGDIEFVGVASTGKKIRKTVEPGDHFFVVGGEAYGPLKAKVEANKAYYVRVEPRMGWLKARFVNVVVPPEELAQESTQKDLKGSTLVEVNSSGEEWFKNQKASMSSKMDAAKEKYVDETEEEKKFNTLTPEMGIDQLY